MKSKKTPGTRTLELLPGQWRALREQLEALTENEPGKYLTLSVVLGLMQSSDAHEAAVQTEKAGS